MKVIYLFVAIFLVAGLCSFFPKDNPAGANFKFPYKKAGLNERQAAAHLLSRFTYGVKPGDVDKVVKMGLENWFQQQLEGNLNDDSLNEQLSQYKDLNLSNTEVTNKFPRDAEVLRMAIKDGSINKDSVNKGDGKAYKKELRAYMQEKGLEPRQELDRQFYNQKILRAAYSNNQLKELLTDFWFNHFNVSFTKNQTAPYIPAYERDVIRPNVAGSFQTLLLATAKSPAMLSFLDNNSSRVQVEPKTDIAMQMASQDENVMDKQMDSAAVNALKIQSAKNLKLKKKPAGLNENYAREVMELHTLGVDGGYTQSDVTQAAGVLTGWTIAPISDFLFVPKRHDNKEKIVLGHKFGPNGGYQEGLDLLTMLARHPATARFISKKIATRFVNDSPSASLVDLMAKTFTKSDGDIKQVMLAMVSSPQFWAAEALRQKTKSPFELAISAVRSLNAEITQPYQLYVWINKMGQNLYHYQAPTGFPDRGQYWINTGALLNRMNFGLALATRRIQGVKIDLVTLNNNHEPESAAAALVTYSKIIMPERNLDATIKRLKPMLTDPELADKVENAAAKEPVNQAKRSANMGSVVALNALKPGEVSVASSANSMLAQVVGVIIGSPEFQRK
jgi:uncharacterized protein (DUF1800 family)